MNLEIEKNPREKHNERAREWRKENLKKCHFYLNLDQIADFNKTLEDNKIDSTLTKLAKQLLIDHIRDLKIKSEGEKYLL